MWKLLSRAIRIFRGPRSNQIDHSPKIYVVERQSPDWATLDYGYFDQMRAFARMIGRPENLMVDYVRLWDSTFSVSFFEVRAALKEISEASRQEMHDVSRLDIKQATELVDEFALLIFSDDDDWFAPKISKTLKTLTNRESKAIIWRPLVFRKGLEKREVEQFCYTNNYAIRGALAQIYREEFELIAQHWKAQNTLSSNEIDSEFLHDFLSITNRHPASTLELERVLKDQKSSDRLRKAVGQWVEGSEDTDKSLAPWADEYIERTRSVFENLF